MREDYLWDGSGEPDPEVQKLENTLSRFRHKGSAPVFPAIKPAQQRRSFWQMGLSIRLAAATATAVVVLVIAVSFMVVRLMAPQLPQSAWDITPVEGTPKVSGSTRTQKLAVGQVLETDATSKASIRLADTGEISVEPGTRLRLLNSNSAIKRIGLERGTIHVSIWAPPGKFVVDTPSAVAVDLGCIYTLHVDDSGNGLLHTTLGWVGFRLAGHESFIPAGATCRTKKNAGPGIPYFEESKESFRSALARFESENSASALQPVLAQAGRQDAFTLWHLLSRVSDSDRGPVYDRLAELAPPPPGVTREGILHLDHKMLDLWWNKFDLGDISLWRHWEREWATEMGK